MSTIYEESYFILGAGDKQGAVYLSAEDVITPRPELAFRLQTRDEATTAIKGARARWPSLDWQVFGAHTKSTISPA